MLFSNIQPGVTVISSGFFVRKVFFTIYIGIRFGNIKFYSYIRILIKHNKMTQSKKTQKTKLCKQCNTIKPVDKFGFTKTGIQGWCSSCRGKQANSSTKKANKEGVIYSITNPIGETYIGQSNMIPKYRWMMHKACWNTKPGQYPLLHQSFDIWGYYAHEFKVIENHGNISKNDLREIESNMINAFKLNGKSLNVKD